MKRFTKDVDGANLSLFVEAVTAVIVILLVFSSYQ